MMSLDSIEVGVPFIFPYPSGHTDFPTICNATRTVAVCFNVVFYHA